DLRAWRFRFGRTISLRPKANTKGALWAIRSISAGGAEAPGTTQPATGSDAGNVPTREQLSSHTVDGSHAPAWELQAPRNQRQGATRVAFPREPGNEQCHHSSCSWLSKRRGSPVSGSSNASPRASSFSGCE